MKFNIVNNKEKENVPEKELNIRLINRCVGTEKRVVLQINLPQESLSCWYDIVSLSEKGIIRCKGVPKKLGIELAYDDAVLLILEEK